MSKSTHGGKRDGAGRPPMKEGRKNLVIDASKIEHQLILEYIPSTRLRTQILIQWIQNERIEQ